MVIITPTIAKQIRGYLNRKRHRRVVALVKSLKRSLMRRLFFASVLPDFTQDYLAAPLMSVQSDSGANEAFSTHFLVIILKNGREDYGASELLCGEIYSPPIIARRCWKRPLMAQSGLSIPGFP